MMPVSRREWLLGTSAILLPAVAAQASPSTKATAPVLWLEADALAPAVRAGFTEVIGTVAPVQPQRHSATSAAPFLAMVSRMSAWRGRLVAGVLPAHRAFWLDESVREVGGAWLARGEHALTADGASRHHTTVTLRHPDGMQAVHRQGQSLAPAQEWARALGQGLAMNSLAYQTEQLPTQALLAPLNSLSPALASEPDTARYASFVILL
jgi:hypothetical protein